MVIIGAGRIGGALHRELGAAGEPVALVSRDQGWDALERAPGEPVLVTVRNDDLVEVIARVPLHRRSDLVFIQNGAIREFLSDNALGGSTRGLLFFAVTRRGGAISPGGVSPFTGPHALAVVHAFIAIGLEAQAVDWPRFTAYELEKLIWNAAFGLLCERYETPVGQIVGAHRPELDALVRELSAVGRAALNVELPHDYLMTRLCDYSLTIASYRGAVKEWRWRNGWFVNQATRRRVSTPVHLELLRAVGREALLDG